MNHHFELHAQQEFEDAVAYYDGVSPRLGNDFIEEVERVISQILNFPKACPELSSSTRPLSHKAVSLRASLPP